MAYRFTQTADELQDIMDLAQSHIATPHSIETSYSKDDYCTYEGALYKALEDVSGAWDESKWEEVTVGEELANLGSVSSAGVELTQAEYDALEVKDPETIYFIKDASNGHSKADASDVAYGDGTVADALDKKLDSHIYLADGVNLNNVTNDGEYIASASVTNAPLAEWAFVSARGELHNGVKYVVQTWKRFNDNLKYVRTRGSDATWSPWTIDYDLYSTTELRCGTWIDGKPIYRKTVKLNNIQVSNQSTASHGIANIDTVIGVKAVYYDGTNGGMPYPMTTLDGKFLNIAVTASVIQWRGTATFSGHIHYITIEYTKTTD